MSDNPSEPRAELASLAAALRGYLEWQQDAGTVGFPKRTAVSVSAPTPAPASTPASAPANVPVPANVPAPASTPAPASLDRAIRLPQLAQEVASCTKCALAATRTQTVFA